MLSPSESVHSRDLRTVFGALQEGGWRLRQDKCQLFRKQFDFLGLKLDATRRSPTGRELQQLRTIPQTQTDWGWVKRWLNQLDRFIFNGVVVKEALSRSENSKLDVNWEAFLGLMEEHRCIVPIRNRMWHGVWQSTQAVQDGVHVFSKRGRWWRVHRACARDL